MSSSESPRKPSMDDVTKKMEKLNITGWSSMGEVSPELHTACLKEIERIGRRRKKAVQSSLKGE